MNDIQTYRAKKKRKNMLSSFGLSLTQSQSDQSGGSMELSTFINGIHSHNQVIHHALLTGGLYVMHEKKYSYTVGMKNIGAPDLIMFGQASDVSEEIFLVLFQAAKLGLVCLEQSNDISQILDPQPRLEVFSQMEKRRHLFAARTYYGSWDFEAIKVAMESRG